MLLLYSLLSLTRSLYHFSCLTPITTTPRLPYKGGGLLQYYPVALWHLLAWLPITTTTITRITNPYPICLCKVSWHDYLPPLLPSSSPPTLPHNYLIGLLAWLSLPNQQHTQRATSTRFGVISSCFVWKCIIRSNVTFNFETDIYKQKLWFSGVFFSNSKLPIFKMRRMKPYTVAKFDPNRLAYFPHNLVYIKL